MIDAPPIIPVAGRSCEGCAMCCKLGSIAEVEKPDGEWCRHCSTRKSCDIYDSRPTVCRTYYCFYMLSDINEDWRPTTAHLTVSTLVNNLVYIMVDPEWPDAWRKEPYFSQIHHWSSQARVVVFVGPHVFGIATDRIDDLGMLEDGHYLMEYHDPTPAGVIKRTRKIHKSQLSAEAQAQLEANRLHK